MENAPLDLAAWSAVVGTLLPLVISLVKSANATTQVKRAVAVIVSIVASVVTTGAVEGWNFADGGSFWQLLIWSFTPIYALSQTTYQGFWKDTAIETSLENVGGAKGE